MPAGSTNSSVDALWAEHAAAVRRQLLKHGVPPTDLDDVVQEVFMVAHDLGDELAKVQHPEARLREVSRRVAAGYRRRAHRRRELPRASHRRLTRPTPMPSSQSTKMSNDCITRSGGSMTTPRRSDRPDRHGRHRSVARPADAGGSAADRREPAARRGLVRLQGWFPGSRRLRAARPSAAELGRR